MAPRPAAKPPPRMALGLPAISLTLMKGVTLGTADVTVEEPETRDLVLVAVSVDWEALFQADADLVEVALGVFWEALLDADLEDFE